MGKKEYSVSIIIPYLDISLPPFHIGDLMLPCLAFPKPFCGHGFLPPPRISALVLVFARLCGINSVLTSKVTAYLGFNMQPFYKDILFNRN